jgi:hypothetical protein
VAHFHQLLNVTEEPLKPGWRALPAKKKPSHAPEVRRRALINRIHTPDPLTQEFCSISWHPRITPRRLRTSPLFAAFTVILAFQTKKEMVVL